MLPNLLTLQIIFSISNFHPQKLSIIKNHQRSICDTWFWLSHAMQRVDSCHWVIRSCCFDEGNHLLSFLLFLGAENSKPNTFSILLNSFPCPRFFNQLKAMSCHMLQPIVGTSIFKLAAAVEVKVDEKLLANMLLVQNFFQWISELWSTSKGVSTNYITIYGAKGLLW